jgi:hypothetical protein
MIVRLCCFVSRPQSTRSFLADRCRASGLLVIYSRHLLTSIFRRVPNLELRAASRAAGQHGQVAIVMAQQFANSNMILADDLSPAGGAPGWSLKLQSFVASPSSLTHSVSPPGSRIGWLVLVNERRQTLNAMNKLAGR